MQRLPMRAHFLKMQTAGNKREGKLSQSSPGLGIKVAISQCVAASCRQQEQATERL
jgi:hypothetical protein